MVMKKQLIFVLFTLCVLSACQSGDANKKSKNEAENHSTLIRAMQETQWIDSEEGFKVPEIMQKSEFFDENVPTMYITYSWESVILSHCFLGVWAASDEEFPIQGSALAPNINVADVTYRQSSKGIFSGHTTNGNIFYLKRIIGSPGEEIPHPRVLTLIYPEDFQEVVQPIIEVVNEWSVF